MEPIIQVKNLSKQYEIARRNARYTTFRETLLESLKSPFKAIKNHEKTKFWALKDISFEVNEGQTIGIMGAMVQVSPHF